MRVSLQSTVWLFGALTLGCGGDDGLKVHPTPPDVVIAAPTDGSTHYRGETVSLLALITLYDGSDFVDASYQWWDGTEPICGAEGSFSAEGFATCEWTFAAAGERTISIEARDASDEMASASISMSIIVEEQRQLTFCAAGGHHANDNTNGVFCMSPTDIAGTPTANETTIWQPGPIYWVSP